MVHDAGGTRLAAAELPDELTRTLERRCVRAGVELLKPPYDGSTLPGAIDAAHVGVILGGVRGGGGRCAC